jgi:hypothetical protein
MTEHTRRGLSSFPHAVFVASALIGCFLFSQVGEVRAEVTRTIEETLDSRSCADSAFSSSQLAQRIAEVERRLHQLSTYITSTPASMQQYDACEVGGGDAVSSTGGFCVSMAKTVGGNELWCEFVAGKLADLFQGKTVVDMGAGLGHYTRYVREQKRVKFMVAYDGGIGCHERTHGLVQFLDLAVPNINVGVFDWLLSLEVGVLWSSFTYACETLSAYLTFTMGRGSRQPD